MSEKKMPELVRWGFLEGNVHTVQLGALLMDKENQRLRKRLEEANGYIKHLYCRLDRDRIPLDNEIRSFLYESQKGE